MLAHFGTPAATENLGMEIGSNEADLVHTVAVDFVSGICQQAMNHVFTELIG